MEINNEKHQFFNTCKTSNEVVNSDTDIMDMYVPGHGEDKHNEDPIREKRGAQVVFPSKTSSSTPPDTIHKLSIEVNSIVGESNTFNISEDDPLDPEQQDHASFFQSTVSSLSTTSWAGRMERHKRLQRDFMLRQEPTASGDQHLDDNIVDLDETISNNIPQIDENQFNYVAAVATPVDEDRARTKKKKNPFRDSRVLIFFVLCTVVIAVLAFVLVTRNDSSVGNNNDLGVDVGSMGNSNTNGESELILLAISPFFFEMNFIIENNGKISSLLDLTENHLSGFLQESLRGYDFQYLSLEVLNQARSVRRETVDTGKIEENMIVGQKRKGEQPFEMRRYLFKGYFESNNRDIKRVSEIANLALIRAFMTPSLDTFVSTLRDVGILVSSLIVLDTFGNTIGSSVGISFPTFDPTMIQTSMTPPVLKTEAPNVETSIEPTIKISIAPTIEPSIVPTTNQPTELFRIPSISPTFQLTIFPTPYIIPSMSPETTTTNPPTEMTKWYQVGKVLIGASDSTTFGSAMALSSDGQILAIGEIGPNLVKVYNWSGDEWIQRGFNIEGPDKNSVFGQSLALSENGDVLAVGGQSHDNNRGIVRVYEYVEEIGNDVSLNITKKWRQVGFDFLGDAIRDRLGSGLDLSNNGQIVAMSADQFNNNSQGGYAQVFKRSGSTWNQLGFKMVAEQAIGKFGDSLSLSGNGHVVAVGDWKLRYVHVKYWNGTDWATKGTQHPRVPENTPGRNVFGNVVHISYNGEVVAVQGANRGVRIFQFIKGKWEQLGDPFEFGDGSQVLDLSGDGLAIVIRVRVGNNYWLGVYKWNGTKWLQNGRKFEYPTKPKGKFSNDGSRLVIIIPAVVKDNVIQDVGNVTTYELEGID